MKLNRTLLAVSMTSLLCLCSCNKATIKFNNLTEDEMAQAKTTLATINNPIAENNKLDCKVELNLSLFFYTQTIEGNLKGANLNDMNDYNFTFNLGDSDDSFVKFSAKGGVFNIDVNDFTLFGFQLFKGYHEDFPYDPTHLIEVLGDSNFSFLDLCGFNSADNIKGKVGTLKEETIYLFELDEDHLANLISNVYPLENINLGDYVNSIYCGPKMNGTTCTGFYVEGNFTPFEDSSFKFSCSIFAN